MRPNVSDISKALQDDSNWPHFQRFATDLLGKALNLNLVSSELGNDLGRDAQWLSPRTGDLDGVVCVAIRNTAKAAIAKFHQDFNRLIKTGLPNHVVMASNFPIEEAEASEFRQWCRARTEQRPRIEVFGLARLATAAANHTDIFIEYYEADLLSLRHRLLGADDATPVRLNGLRIALATQFNEDGVALRDSLIDACVLLSLSKTQDWMSSHQLCVEVGRQLQLPNKVVPELIELSVQRHAAAERVSRVASSVRIEPPGAERLQELDNYSTTDARTMREGFCAEVTRRLSQDLVRRIGDRLPEIWVRLQELLVDAFWSRSLEVCNRILELSNRPPLPELFGVRAFEPFIAELFATDESMDSVKELANAVVEVVLDRTGIVRQSMLNTVVKFVALCSIGIHPEAYEEVNAKLQKWLMLLDTHVLISWLCTGEADHDALCALIESWKRLGRRIAVPEPVLEETAYHAWRSNEEAKGLPGDRGRTAKTYFAETAFLRTFLLQERGQFSPGRWRAFMTKFGGETKTDTSAIEEELKTRQITAIKISSSESPGPRVHRGPVVRPTVRLSKEGEGEIELKPIWDRRLIEIATMCKRQQEQQGGGVVVVSDSGALRAAMETRLPRDRVAVKSAASVGFAMAMLPGSSLSLAHLRELLFDDQPFLALITELAPLAKKIVHDSYEDGLDQLGRLHLCEALAERVRAAFNRR